MALFGILKDPLTNSGIDSELSVIFSTPLTVRSNQPVLAGDTISLRRVTASQSGHRWEIDTAIAPTNDSNDYLLHSVVHGHHTAFGVRMPQTPKVDLSIDTATLQADVTRGSSTIGVDWANDGTLVAGEFINIEGDTKVYLVINPAVDINGTVSIFPPLRENISAGAEIIHGYSVTMVCKLELDTLIGMTFVDGILMDPGLVRIVEAVTGTFLPPGDGGGGEGGGGE